MRVGTVREVAEQADLIMMTVPDQVAKQVYEQHIADNLQARQHGALGARLQRPLRPGAVAGRRRRDDGRAERPRPPRPPRLHRGRRRAGLIAVHQNATENAKQIALAYAKGIGATRGGVLETTFKEETETDLFGEQTVLCGGVTSLVKNAFETLVEAGYQPELAYFECMHELKLIVDLMYEGGMEYMRYSISDTAEYGDYSRGPRIVDGRVKETMKQVLREIQDGSFAREWILENQAGRPSFNAMRRINAEHQIEEVGAELRGMMSWLKKSR